MTPTFSPAEALALAILLAMVVRQALQVGPRSGQARYYFVTMAGLTVAAAAEMPAVALTIDHLTGVPDLGRVLQYVSAAAAASSWDLACLDLCPAIRARRWLLGLAPVLAVVISLLWWSAVASHVSLREESWRSIQSVLLTMAVHGYFFILVAGIFLPTLFHKRGQEQDRALRLRLSVLITVQLVIGVWSGTTVVVYLLMVGRVLPLNFYDFFAQPLLVALALTYAATFLPAAAYARLVLASDHVRAWWRVGRLLRLERDTARLLDDQSVPVDLADLLRVPDYVLYTLVIAILDRRKALYASQAPSACALATEIEGVSARSLDYPGLISQLQRLVPRP
jgi:hypothetical protein